MLSESKIDFSSRVASVKIDMQNLIPMILPFAIPLIISQISKGKDPSHTNISLSLHELSFYILSVGIALLFCKDCLNGQSPGKRVLQTQVVDVKTNKIATPIRCVVRNLFMILCPIEGVILLVSPARRLGDYIAGTKVASYNPQLPKEKINYSSIIISFLIAYIFCLVLIPILSKY